MEELLFEASYKFIVNKKFPVRSRAFELLQQLSADPAYHQYVLLCKVRSYTLQVTSYKLRVTSYKLQMYMHMSRRTTSTCCCARCTCPSARSSYE